MHYNSSMWSYNKSFHIFNAVYFKKTSGELALRLVQGRFYLTAALRCPCRLAYLYNLDVQLTCWLDVKRVTVSRRKTFPTPSTIPCVKTLYSY
jgi:hypothetical protein